MADIEDTYNSLMSLEDLTRLTTEEVMGHIERLIDISLDVRKTHGIEHAIELSEELQKRMGRFERIVRQQPIMGVGTGRDGERDHSPPHGFTWY